MILALACSLGGILGCGSGGARRVEIATSAYDANVNEIQVAALEVGHHTNLEIARFELRGELSKQRVDTAATAVRDAQFYPAPAGFAWAAIEPGIEIDASTIVSGERLALVNVAEGRAMPLTKFRIIGEEGDEQGARALRIRIDANARSEFDALCREAMRSQLVFLARGRIVLAVDVRAPVAGDIWLTDLPERGVSPFVDRLARIAEVPR